MEWLPLLLGGVSSIASGVMGQNAANQSTKAMTEALTKAMKYDKQTLSNVLGMNKDTIGKVLGLNRDATDASVADINAGVDRALGISDAAEAKGRADLAPWMTTGAQALEAYAGELGLTGTDGKPYVSKFREQPGYQFAKAEGEKSVVNNMRALGLGGSGAAMKALDRYGQGIADQQYDQYMDRLSGVSDNGQSAATTAANITGQTASDKVGAVLGGANSTANTRLSGTANAGNTLMTGNNNAIDAILNRSGNISDNMINLGTAQGAGTVAGTNSWTSALKDFTNSLGRTLGSTSSKWGNILGGGNYAGGVAA